MMKERSRPASDSSRIRPAARLFAAGLVRWVQPEPHAGAEDIADPEIGSVTLSR